MAAYKCGKCGMSVGSMTCGQCNVELKHGSLEVGGGSVAISECPNGHGKVKSPLCCGDDMACEVG